MIQYERQNQILQQLEKTPSISIRKLAATGELGESFELDEDFDLSGLDEE
jgi:hypothetical protein